MSSSTLNLISNGAYVNFVPANGILTKGLGISVSCNDTEGKDAL